MTAHTVNAFLLTRAHGQDHVDDHASLDTVVIQGVGVIPVHQVCCGVSTPSRQHSESHVQLLPSMQQANLSAMNALLFLQLGLQLLHLHA